MRVRVHVKGGTDSASTLSLMYGIITLDPELYLTSISALFIKRKVYHKNKNAIQEKYFQISL